MSEVLHDRVKLTDIKPMTDREYTVRGCTALIDAIGGAIYHIGNVHKYARPEDVPEHTVFVITTDGMENASHLYNNKQVKDMIERQKEKMVGNLYLLQQILMQLKPQEISELTKTEP